MDKYHTLLIIFILIGTTRHIYASNPEQNSHADLRLLEAAKNLDVTGVKSALTNGANPNYTIGLYPKIAHSAINRAIGSVYKKEEVQCNCMTILTLLFEAGAKIQTCDEGILYKPIIENLPLVVELLLKYGANPNGLVGGGKTPVELAEYYARGEIVPVLVRYGGNTISRVEAAQLRLIHSVIHGTIVDIEKLMKEGARVNGLTKQGETALSSTLVVPVFTCDQYAKLVYLLQKGANPNLEGAEGVCGPSGVPTLPLHIAMFSTHFAFDDHFPESARRVYARLIIEALIKAGADVSAHGENGATPLQVAAIYNNIMGAEMLIKAGADVSDRGRDGLTPLHTAINTNLKLAKMLIEAGADVSARVDISGIRGTRYEKLAESTYGGMTPIHVAAKFNNLEGVKILIEAGAKIMPKDETGKTPLQYAESAEMIKLLKYHGAKEK